MQMHLIYMYCMQYGVHTLMCICRDSTEYALYLLCTCIDSCILGTARSTHEKKSIAESPSCTPPPPPPPPPPSYPGHWPSAAAIPPSLSQSDKSLPRGSTPAAAFPPPNSSPHFTPLELRQKDASPTHSPPLPSHCIGTSSSI